jgi:hypothetical protein
MMSSHTSDFTPTCQIPIGSVNHALRAQRLLQQNGYATAMVKSPTQAKGGGCLYGLSISCVLRESAVRLLRKSGLQLPEL